jgi:hypothetical protein
VWTAVSLFALLLTLYSLTLLVRPYASPEDNTLESAMLLVSLLLYSAQISSNLQQASGASGLAYAVATGSLIAKAFALALLIRTLAQRLRLWAASKRQGSGVVKLSGGEREPLVRVNDYVPLYSDLRASE